ncbi:hypothetical protein PVAND_015139 [Polypedilum vanderplanki]|uniref:Odorant binding protein n=1 Tax=Polypedilum vanderplanki TaxID=319348 RepID=A0A9J6BC32_POLVA|nr:hypothetical protein PVAND_015139 [Polypedilum vanderplanki]
MKFLSAVLILIVSAAMVKSIDLEEKKKMMMAAVASCKSSTGASDDDVTKLMMHKDPGTKEGKCMINCFFESMGMIKDGKMNKEGLLAWGKSMGDSEEIIQKVLAECEDVSDPDVCESGMKIGFCLKQNIKKFKPDME